MGRKKGCRNIVGLQGKRGSETPPSSVQTGERVVAQWKSRIRLVQVYLSVWPRMVSRREGCGFLNVCVRCGC